MDYKNMLLCKAKRLDNNEWVTGWYTGFSLQGNVPCIMPIKGNPRTFIPIDENTVCLNTLAKDMNGQPLFSDDIIGCGAFKGHIKAAAGPKGTWAFYITWYQNGRAVDRQMLHDLGYVISGRWTYVGNAHDSRDILTERET